MPPLKDTDYRLLAEFRYLLRRFLAFSEKQALDISLTPQQHQALLSLKAMNMPMTIGDLAERLMIRHNSAVGLVDRLADGGFVVRRADAEDGRRAILELTKSGEAVLAKLTAAHREELRRMAPLLKPLLAQLQS